MSNSIRLCLVLHNHQPIGNFDHVFEAAYRESYLPFLDVFESYDALSVSLHTSGPLMEWLDEHHPEYLERLRSLVARGRVEIIGGAFYEPILTMIPSRDRLGQIETYSQWLERRLGGGRAADVAGAAGAQRAGGNLGQRCLRCARPARAERTGNPVVVSRYRRGIAADGRRHQRRLDPRGQGGRVEREPVKRTQVHDSGVS